LKNRGKRVRARKRTFRVRRGGERGGEGRQGKPSAGREETHIPLLIKRKGSKICSNRKRGAFGVKIEGMKEIRR